MQDPAYARFCHASRGFFPDSARVTQIHLSTAPLTCCNAGVLGWSGWTPHYPITGTGHLGALQHDGELPGSDVPLVLLCVSSDRRRQGIRALHARFQLSLRMVPYTAHLLDIPARGNGGHHHQVCSAMPAIVQQLDTRGPAAPGGGG
jgi:hypothetical protein